MNKRQSLTAATIVVAALAAAGTLTATATNRAAVRKQETAKIAAARAQVQRGEYLVNIGGCNDCHTPLKMGKNGPEPDRTRLLSGHPESLQMPPAPKLPAGPWQWVGAGTSTAFSGPWGVSYAANLTPDRLTGIGIWNEETFIRTIRTGRHWGVSRPILPPMPWQNVRGLTDSDLKAVFAYLQSIQPIRNQVPDAVVAQ